MGSLYVTDNSAAISLDSNCIIVKYGDGMKSTIPIETLESISIFGRSQLTTQCTQECLKRGIPVSYYSKGGSYFGKLQSTGHINAERQRKQAVMKEQEWSLVLAAKIIRAKIHNQSIVMSRYAKNKEFDVSESYAQMKILAKKILDADSIEQMMGYEGKAARIYFDVLSKLIDKDFEFHGRNRRPPRDPFNSMLSMGYSILMNEVYGKLELRGLNPYFGFIHQDKENHPTLASDLMEEWRALIVDSLVMSLVNGHEINKEHFINDIEHPGVYLTKEGMQIFLKKLENKMHSSTKYITKVDYPVSFRRAIELQVASLVNCLETQNSDAYDPVWIR